MVSNQALRAHEPWARLGVCALLAALAGCSSSWNPLARERPQTASPAATRAASTEPGEAVAPEPDLTATEAATEGASAEAAATSPEVVSPELKPTAPKSYTVQRGDTLWGIASMYLRDPWLWPEIWTINPNIQNPHLIYPGDVLALAFGGDGRPQVTVERGSMARLNPRLRSSPIEGPIATIPYEAIAAFLGRPSVLAKEQIRNAPHVLALRGEHMVGGAGHEIYVRSLAAPEKSSYSVYHIGERLRDPETGDVLGYEGLYAATATVTRAGEPAKAVLSDSARETLEGDRLIATEVDVPLNFTPRAPSTDVRGQIVSVIDGVELIGQFQVVAINRGRRHGVEPGHVLAVDDAGEVVRDRTKSFAGMAVGSAFAPKVRLPDERSGTMLVFKTYEDMSFGLIVAAEDVIRVADRVRNP